MKNFIFVFSYECVMDRLTGGPTEKPSLRDASRHLKNQSHGLTQPRSPSFGFFPRRQMGCPIIRFSSLPHHSGHCRRDDGFRWVDDVVGLMLPLVRCCYWCWFVDVVLVTDVGSLLLLAGCFRCWVVFSVEAVEVFFFSSLYCSKSFWNCFLK